MYSTQTGAMDHEHCRGCVNSFCAQTSDCPVDKCRNGCGFSFHRCKAAEHEQLSCPEARVSCTNATYGCEELLPRKALKTHLVHCPASILQCRFVHTRTFARSNHNPEEAAQDDLIDKQLLNGDTSLADALRDDTEHTPLPLGSSMINDGYISLHRRGSHTSLTANRGRQCHCKAKEVSFCCNEIVRRDEFFAHWKTFHLDVQLSLDRLVERCPLRAYGCSHGRQHILPSPPGTSLSYDRDRDSFLVSSHSSIPPGDEGGGGDGAGAGGQGSAYQAKLEEKRELALYGYGEEEESYDVLCQLPVEVLLTILQHLDSVSLWNMSQVNSHLRKVCFCVVQRRGLVYRKWARLEDETHPLGSRWVCSPKVGLVFLKLYMWLCSLTLCNQSV